MKDEGNPDQLPTPGTRHPGAAALRAGAESASRPGAPQSLRPPSSYDPAMAYRRPPAEEMLAWARMLDRENPTRATI